MPRRETYGQGSPCWVDYMAADPEGARDFYATLFGWTFDEPEEYGYRLARRAGEVVGGFGQVPPGRGLTATWNTYLAAKDADAVAARVKELGGAVVLGPLPAGGTARPRQSGSDGNCGSRALIPKRSSTISFPSSSPLRTLRSFLTTAW